MSIADRTVAATRGGALTVGAGTLGPVSRLFTGAEISVDATLV
ncbi:hypothetical protein [Mycolicibacter icosiumassiliensis]|nr:hypothetical protein [Mycolicibacter icosiumassiliensis]